MALFLAGLAGELACRQVGTADLREAQACLDRLIEADNRGDLDAVMGCYGRDARLVPPAGAEIVGREAVRQHYARLFSDARPSLRIEHGIARLEGDDIVDRGRAIGTITPADGGPDERVDDEYEAILRREDGGWRVMHLRWRPRHRRSRGRALAA